MIVVSDSSPLIILAKLGCFELLHQAFPRIYISSEVCREVVVSGTNLPGAAEVTNADWTETKPIQAEADLKVAQRIYPLGAGELSTLILSRAAGRFSAS